MRWHKNYDLIESGIGYRALVEQHFHKCVEYYYQNCYHPMLDTIPLFNTPYHPLPMRWDFFYNKLLVDGRSVLAVEEEMANMSCDCYRCCGDDDNGEEQQQEENETEGVCTCTSQNTNDNKINNNNSTSSSSLVEPEPLSPHNDNAKIISQHNDTTNGQDAQPPCALDTEDVCLSDDENNNNIVFFDHNASPSHQTTSTQAPIVAPTTPQSYTFKCAVCIRKEQVKQPRNQCKKEMPFYSPVFPRNPPPTPHNVFYHGINVTNRLMLVVGVVDEEYEDYFVLFE